MRPCLATGIVLSLIATGCNEREEVVRPQRIKMRPITSVSVVSEPHYRKPAKKRMTQAMKDFWTICHWEGRGVINHNNINVSENARGAANIRPCFLTDANEWLGKHGMKQYTHKDMHDPEKAFIACQAYWRRYGLKTTEERCRAHAGGPDGPEQECTMDYWRGCQTYM